MAVAKSFEGLEIVKEPYMTNGRMYVQVRTKVGTIRTVRWYTEKEYAKYYPNEKKPAVSSQVTQKTALGFDETGFITIFKGDTFACKEWFKEHHARYTRLWGWGFGHGDALPEDNRPLGIEPIRLDWEMVGNPDGSLKSDEAVKAAVDALVYEPDVSEFVGTVGQRIEMQVTVEKAIQLDGYYGPSTMHIMRGIDGNVYVWTTASKSWEEGSEKTIRGTIKDHKTYRAVNQTILTRCMEVTSK